MQVEIGLRGEDEGEGSKARLWKERRSDWEMLPSWRRRRRELQNGATWKANAAIIAQLFKGHTDTNTVCVWRNLFNFTANVWRSSSPGELNGVIGNILPQTFKMCSPHPFHTSNITSL